MERAIAIAAEAHAGQRDRGGQPYVLHVLRVMQRMTSEEDRIAAVLHDLLEDTPWRREDLEREGFCAAVVDAVVALTRRTGESYRDFIRRAGANPIARRVKLADLEDNMDLSRIEPTPRNHERTEKYRRAHRTLDAMGRDNKEREGDASPGSRAE